MSSSDNNVVWKTFKALSERAERKFARVRDLPPYVRTQNHYFPKVFKSYMRLWKYQQENRSKLLQSGLNRWEIGEIASRIGQLYFNQYMRTSEGRFLVEAYVFYEAILVRKYFEGLRTKEEGIGVRAKELRFYARFLVVCLVLNKVEMVDLVVERLQSAIEEVKASFREMNFKEWKIVVQEITRFTKAAFDFTKARPLRYCAVFDTHPTSLPYVTRYHAKKVLKFQDALLTSYHRNEVKFAELTLDTYRMLQCLEWDVGGSFQQKLTAKSNENGGFIDHSGASGVMDISLGMDIADPSLPPNPRKSLLYRPSATHLIAVIATICEELPPESLMMMYLSAPGKASQYNNSRIERSGGSSKSSKSKVMSEISYEQSGSTSESSVDDNRISSDNFNSCLWLGPRGNGGSNNLFPADIIPFTRRPLFLIIDSDNSHAFKVIHGAEREEAAALFLSPLKPVYKNQSDVNITEHGSQFTFFLTAPLLAFCEIVGYSPSESELDNLKNAESILASAFSAWEVILCTSTDLDLVWAQVLSDPFIRRLILRFIFCRSILSGICPPEESDQYLPVCLPSLPNCLSSESKTVQSIVLQIADCFGAAKCFEFTNV